MRLVVLSDTHNRHHGLAVPDGDVLVHCGDFTGHGSPAEIAAFDAFLAGLPHRHKVVIAGNHDFGFERRPAESRALLRHATYLQDSGVTIDGVRFWGSPWQPWFYDWAFNLPRGPRLREKWALIPDDTDVLITHGPPHGILDLTARGEPVGCEELLERVRALRPRVHLFGHIHEASGRETRDGVLFVNASICNLGYEPVQAVQIVDLA